MNRAGFIVWIGVVMCQRANDTMIKCVCSEFSGHIPIVLALETAHSCARAKGSIDPEKIISRFNILPMIAAVNHPPANLCASLWAPW